MKPRDKAHAWWAGKPRVTTTKGHPPDPTAEGVYHAG